MITYPGLSPAINGFLLKETTQAFLKTAKQFVDLLEQQDISLYDFMQQSHGALIELYAAGKKLEQIDILYPDVHADFDRDELFDNKANGLISQLGEQVFYWETFDPSVAKEDTPSLGDLTDDYGDIYKDLKIELIKMKAGTNEALQDALWQFKWGFDHHWGFHCINAMRYLHWRKEV